MIPVEVVQATVILMAWSLLYKENIFYRIGEAMVVGLYLGVTLNYAVDVLGKMVYTPLFIKGQWFSTLTIVTLLGLLFYTRFIRPIWWMSRWPIAILGAVGSAVAVMGAIGPQILRQLLTDSLIAPDPLTTVNRLLLVIITITTMSHFIFTYRQKGVLGASAFVGRIFMMMAFGYMLASLFMSNIAFAIDNMSVLAVPPGAYVSVIAILILLGSLWLERAKAKKT